MLWRVSDLDSLVVQFRSLDMPRATGRTVDAVPGSPEEDEMKRTREEVRVNRLASVERGDRSIYIAEMH